MAIYYNYLGMQTSNIVAAWPSRRPRVGLPNDIADWGPSDMQAFDLDDTAFLLIDHQTGTNSWAVSTPLGLLETNVLKLAKFAAGTHTPVVLTSSQETNVQGPLMPELQTILPEAYKARIKRHGIVNSWDDPAFAGAAVETGRKNFVMAGVTTEVCVAGPALSATQAGFNVKVVCDACGSPTQMAEEVAWRRMEQGGVGLSTVNAMLAELAKDWTTPAGQIAHSVLTD